MAEWRYIRDPTTRWQTNTDPRENPQSSLKTSDPSRHNRQKPFKNQINFPYTTSASNREDMGSIIKGALLLLCAMAWAGAGPLPRPSPCPPDRNVTPNTFAQYRQMLETFRHVVNNTDDLRKRAQAYFKDIVSSRKCTPHTHTHTHTQSSTDIQLSQEPLKIASCSK